MSATKLLEAFSAASVEDLRSQIATLESDRDRVVTKMNSDIDLIRKLIMVKSDKVALRPPTLTEVASRYVPEDFPAQGEQDVAGIIPAPKIVVDHGMEDGTWALVGTSRREPPPPTAGEQTKPTAILCRPEHIGTARKVIDATEPARAQATRSQEKRLKAQMPPPLKVEDPTPARGSLASQIATYLDVMGPAASGVIARGIKTIDKDAVTDTLENDSQFVFDQGLWNLRAKVEAKM